MLKKYGIFFLILGLVLEIKPFVFSNANIQRSLNLMRINRQNQSQSERIQRIILNTEMLTRRSQQTNSLTVRSRSFNSYWIREAVDKISLLYKGKPSSPLVFQAGSFLRKYSLPAAWALVCFGLGFGGTSSLTAEVFRKHYSEMYLSSVQNTAAELAKLNLQEAFYRNYIRNIDFFFTLSSLGSACIGLAGYSFNKASNKYTVIDEEKSFNRLCSAAFTRTPLFFVAGLAAGYAADSYLKYKLAQ